MKLTNWFMVKNFDGSVAIVGTITGDEKGRFKDGQAIQTSRVMKYEQREDGTRIAQTQNSVYELE